MNIEEHMANVCAASFGVVPPPEDWFVVMIFVGGTAGVSVVRPPHPSHTRQGVFHHHPVDTVRRDDLVRLAHTARISPTRKLVRTTGGVYGNSCVIASYPDKKSALAHAAAHNEAHERKRALEKEERAAYRPRQRNAPVIEVRKLRVLLKKTLVVLDASHIELRQEIVEALP